MTKKVLLLLVSIMYLKVTLSNEMKLVVPKDVLSQWHIDFQPSPNGEMIAIASMVTGQVIIYDREGNVLKSRVDHDTTIAQIYWLDNDRGPITLSQYGQFAIWNGLEGQPTYFQTKQRIYSYRSFNSGGAWKVSDDEQYVSSAIGYYYEYDIIEWDIIKQVKTGVYRVQAKQYSGFIHMSYTENNKYLVFISLNYDRTFLEFFYFNTSTKLVVNKMSVKIQYEYRDIRSILMEVALGMGISPLNSNIIFSAVNYTYYEQGNYSYFLQYFPNKTNKILLPNYNSAIAYCGDSYVVTGGLGYIAVYDWKKNYLLVQNITGIPNSLHLTYIQCAGNYVYARTPDDQIYVGKIEVKEDDDKVEIREIPLWIIILVGFFLLVVIAAIFACICIKQKLGYSAYKCFLMWRQKSKQKKESQKQQEKLIRENLIEDEEARAEEEIERSRKTGKSQINRTTYSKNSNLVNQDLNHQVVSEEIRKSDG